MALVDGLCSSIQATEFDDVSKALVGVFDAHGEAVRLLRWAIHNEIKCTGMMGEERRDHTKKGGTGRKRKESSYVYFFSLFLFFSLSFSFSFYFSLLFFVYLFQRLQARCLEESASPRSSFLHILN